MTSRNSSNTMLRRTSRWFKVATLGLSMVIGTTIAYGQVSALLNPTYGYTFASSSGAYTALAGGTVFQTGAAISTDANSAAITLPFAFTFNGVKENTIFINNNGYITFALAQTTASNTVPLSTTTTSGFDGAIAGLANNLAASSAVGAVPEIRYGTNGGGDFVVQFQDVGISASAGTRATFQIILQSDAKTVSIVYGPNNTGIAGASGSQVGLRGTNDEDWNNRSLSSGGNWNTSGGAAGTVNTNTMTWTATSTLPASGLTFTWSPTAYTPTYSATPFSCQEFTAWVNGAGPANVPSSNWASNGYGNASWQIDNTTASTTGSGWGGTSGSYSPADYLNAVGGRSARFHSQLANSPQVGYLDYYVNLSSATGSVVLDFFQINTSGTDILQVFVSTNGGTTFAQVGANLGVAATWTARNITLGAITSATTIIRFKGTSDFGSTDIGLDHVCLSVPACPAPIIASVTQLTPTTASVSWTGAALGVVEWGASGCVAGTTNTAGACGNVVLGSSPQTISGLVPNTTYSVYVRQDCTGSSNGYSTNASTSYFNAPTCPTGLGVNSVTIGSLPYSTTAQTTCGSGNNVTSTNVVSVCGSASYYLAEDRTYIFTPTSTGVYNILLTTGTDDDAGIQLYQGCPFTSGSTCVANAQSTTGLTRTLNPTLTSGITYYLVVDNFTAPACIGTYSLSITPPLACPTPTGVAAGSVTATSASITWTCSGCTGTFDLDYGPNPHTAGTGTIITGVTSPYVLNPPLTSNTGYQVFIRQDCSNTSNGIGAWSTGATFTTLTPPPVCPGGLGVNSVTVGSLPYSTTAQTTCGSGNNVTSANVVSLCGSTSYYGAEDRTYIFTPTISGVHTILLTTATDDDAGIHLYQGCPFTTGSTCLAFAQSTTGLTRTLNPTLTSGITYYLVVDNWTAPACIGTYSLSITPPTACPAPTAVAAGSVTTTSASITWSCSGCTGTFELDYGANPHTAGTGTIITGVTSPYVLNPPLASSTGYQVFVRQDCSNTSNGIGAWSAGATFTTLAPPPANDICAGAIAIPTAGPFPYTTAIVNNSSATDGTDPVSTCQANSHKGVWYTYTPAVTGSYTISSCQSAAAGNNVTDNILAIYTSTNGCAGPYTQVACDDDACVTLNFQAVITTALTCGTQYYILASGYDTNIGNIQLVVTPPACSVAAFNVTGGGAYCSGDAGVSVGLDGSELCFDYQLFRDATPLATLPGTGAALDFGLQAIAGTYTVVSTNSAIGTCTASMTGSVVVSVTTPSSATISYDGSPYCSSAGTATPTFSGTTGGSYSSNAGLTIDGSTGVVTLGTSTAATYTVTYTVAAGVCPAFQATASITITQATTWYSDLGDSDGLGDPNVSQQACSQPSGYVADNSDSCPNNFGTVGSACDAGPSFVLGQLNASCACVGVACTSSLNLDVTMPAFGTLPTWELRDAETNLLVQSGGGGFGFAGINPTTTCLPDGTFKLIVNGMPAGGAYVLRTSGNPGTRIIDNETANSGTTQVSEFTTTPVVLSSGGPVHIPVGPTALLFTSCDKPFWKAGEYVVTNEDPQVAATWIPNVADNAQSATSGYDFWIYNPNGGYSYIRQRRNNVSDNFAAVGSSRTCHMKVNNWATANHIPNNVKMNIRVRAVVNNVPKNWGPACRFIRDEALANCPPTKLFDVPGFPQFYSCGVTRAFTSQSSNRLYARPVSGANKYKFTINSAELATPIVRIVSTYYLSLGWTSGPIMNDGETYDVTVQASFNNGATYCVVGDVCLVTIQNNVNGGQQNIATDSNTATLNMWPNPNKGDELYVSLSAVQEGVNTVSMEIHDLSGKRMIARTLAVQDGFLNTVVNLNGDLSAGMYIVNFTAGDVVYTQRVVIQP